MRELGVRAIFGPCASGSLQAEMAPGDFVVPDQIVDRTAGRARRSSTGPTPPVPPHHARFADPYDARLRTVAVDACQDEGVTGARGRHGGRHPGAALLDPGRVAVVRRPGLGGHQHDPEPEAVLAAELGIPYATIALITDYDAGLEGQPGIEPVTMDEVMATLARNAEQVRKVLFRAVADLPDELFAEDPRGPAATGGFDSPWAAATRRSARPAPPG